MLVFLISPYALAKTPRGQKRFKSYPQASKVFWSDLYPNGGVSLYCGSQFKGKKTIAGEEVNIEHVFPAYWIVQNIGCGSRKECQRHSRKFKRAEADLHNLFPSEKSINQYRGNYLFSLIPGEAREFGDCDFEVDKRRQVVEPREDVRGDIARAVLYMMDTYGFTLNKVNMIEGRPIDPEDRAVMMKHLEEWNVQDPPSSSEKAKNELILKIQGTRNIYIK